MRNGVLAITEEMKTNLMRTAYNMIIYEALDFTVGLFTADGDTVSIGLGLPMFIRGMAETIKAKLAHFGADGIEPGDILVTNDAYITGSHLNHFTFTLPIFHDGELVGFACCMAHWLDVGGTLGGVTTDIYSEGLQIPIVKYQQAGRGEPGPGRHHPHERAPARARHGRPARADHRGDDRRAALPRAAASATAATTCSTRSPTSWTTPRPRRARARASIPDGVYEAESFMDDDGVDIGKRVPIKVQVIVKGDEMTIDLSEVSPQVRGFFNSGPTHRASLRAGRLQVPHLADRLPDQRRQLPPAQGHHAAGHGGERRASPRRCAGG